MSEHNNNNNKQLTELSCILPTEITQIIRGKAVFIAHISTFIKSYINPSQGIVTIDYKDIIEHCIHSDKYKTFLNTKKDILIYLDNIIKYDDALIDYLSLTTQYFITRNRNGFIEFNHPLTTTQLHDLNKKAKKTPSKAILDNLDLSDESKNRFLCPYDIAIKACKQKARNKFRLSLTNEVVFNVYLQSLTEIQHIIKHLQYFNDLKFIHKGHKIQIFKIQGNVGVCDIVFGDEYMTSRVSDKLSNQYVETLRGIYPFTHFNITSLLFNFYLIYKCSNSDSKEFLSYLTFLHIELIKNVLVNKYFANCRKGEVYDNFYKDRLDTVVREQTEFLKVFIDSVSLLPEDETEFTGFIVGYYKMFVYMRNLLNREVKKCAQDYFHTKINRIDVVSYDHDVQKCYGESYAG